MNLQLKNKYSFRFPILITTFLIFFNLIGERTGAQEITQARMKAIYIYKFIGFTEWENEQNITTFSIGLLGDEPELLSELKMLESAKTKNKSIKIVQFNSVANITLTHILYVTREYNFDIERIAKKISENNTLLVTDRCKRKNSLMINFLYPEKNKMKFEVNKSNIENKKLSIDPELLLEGGTEIDKRELYSDSQKELENVNRKLTLLKESLDKQQKEILKYNDEIIRKKDEIKNQKQEIENQKKDVLTQQQKIKEQAEKYLTIYKNVQIQNRILNEKTEKLKEQETGIKKQEKALNDGENKLEELALESEKQIQEINKQKVRLSTLDTKVEKQKNTLFAIIGALVLMLGIAFFIYRNYKIKKEANKELEEKNIAINQQKEEIYRKNVGLEIMTKEVSKQKETIETSYKELEKTHLKLKSTQSQLINSEKMASLGQLTSGIAHEINNPINFIMGNVHPLERDIKDIFDLLEKYNSIIQKNNLKEKFNEAETLKNKMDFNLLTKEINSLLHGINEGAQRTTEIVKGLRTFSRMDEVEFSQADIIEGIDSTLTLLSNKTKNRITIKKEYNNIPTIDCLPSKLNQVFMNILNNSIQAIEDEGEIIIKTNQENDNVIISIKDTGAGMTDDVKKHIFEPFYTTKEVGSGTGLGLSITFGIIEKHNGKIEVKSEPGKGTEFIITLPIYCTT